jgi:hypothetical protein
MLSAVVRRERTCHATWLRFSEMASEGLSTILVSSASDMHGTWRRLGGDSTGDVMRISPFWPGVDAEPQMCDHWTNEWPIDLVQGWIRRAGQPVKWSTRSLRMLHVRKRGVERRNPRGNNLCACVSWKEEGQQFAPPPSSVLRSR